MIKVTAAEVNNLRKATGAGMMDCKKALIEAEGDFEAAIDILRKKGQKVAAKRAERAANEGFVYSGVSSDHNFAVALMVNCETDFVAKNEDFIQFGKQLVNHAIENKISDIEAMKSSQLDGISVAEHLTAQVGKIGEKIELTQYETISSERVFAYNHHGNRLATILGFNFDDVSDEIGNDVAMQIAAMNPIAINQDGVDQKTIAHEIEIGKDQAREAGKPEAMLEKIAMGKLNKFFKENTLLNQAFIKDSKLTVKGYITAENKDLTVTAFKRVALGS